jgi:hypothetical protein
MKFAEMKTVAAGLRFKTRSNLVVTTTGKTLAVTPHGHTAEIYAHEVSVTDGPNKGQVYWHNLDAAQAL